MFCYSIVMLFGRIYGATKYLWMLDEVKKIDLFTPKTEADFKIRYYLFLLIVCSLWLIYGGQ